MLSTFQTLVLAGIECLVRLFPLGTASISELLPRVLEWPSLPSGYVGLLEVELAIALLWFQRHEWLSQLAAFVQIVAYRRKPMTMDERIPFFVLLMLLPALLASPWLSEQIPQIGATPLQSAAYPSLIGVSLGWLLVLATRWGRRKWALYDWKFSSAIFIGVALLATAIPGVDLITWMWALGYLINHRSESTGRMVYWVAAWSLLISGLRKIGDLPWSQTATAEQMSRLSFYAGLFVAGVVALAVARSLRNWIERDPGMKRFAVLRTLMLGAFLLKAWLAR